MLKLLASHNLLTKIFSGKDLVIVARIQCPANTYGTSIRDSLLLSIVYHVDISNVRIRPIRDRIIRLPFNVMLYVTRMTRKMI